MKWKMENILLKNFSDFTIFSVKNKQIKMGNLAEAFYAQSSEPEQDEGSLMVILLVLLASK